VRTHVLRREAEEFVAHDGFERLREELIVQRLSLWLDEKLVISTADLPAQCQFDQNGAGETIWESGPRVQPQAAVPAQGN
jgi:hypothetical protein